MPVPRELILDLEGIAFDPLACSTNAVRRALIRVGRPRPLSESLAWLADVPVSETLHRLLPGEEALHLDFLAHVRRYYTRQRWHGVRAHTGVRAMLRRLRAENGTRVTLVSAQPVTTVRHQIEDLGFDGLFDAVACPESGGCGHCRRRFVAEFTADRDPRDDVVWLTDLPSELTVARQLGVIGIAAGWGRASAVELHAAGATLVASEPAALVAAWDTLGTAGTLAAPAPCRVPPVLRALPAPEHD